MPRVCLWVNRGLIDRTAGIGTAVCGRTDGVNTCDPVGSDSRYDGRAEGALVVLVCNGHLLWESGGLDWSAAVVPTSKKFSNEKFGI